MKYLINVDNFPPFIVAPFAGAWIEIIFYVMDIMRMIVAPFAGAWIEITMQTIFF